MGGGPSLKNIDVECLREHHVIAVNNAYTLADWIPVMFFGDCRWFTWKMNGTNHKAALLNFAGLKITTCDKHVNQPGINVVAKDNSLDGISTNQHVLMWNLSSGACAINLAVLFGVKRIVLLGYDMQRIEGKSNWHDDHQIPNSPAKKKKKPNNQPYDRFLMRFDSIARDLTKLGIECVNATPGSALTLFPIVEPASVLPTAKGIAV